MTLTKREYYEEINSIAEALAKEAMRMRGNAREEAEELINDSLLHETIDGHQWVLYNAYNLEVLGASNNENALTDVCGDEAAAAILVNEGIQGLHQALAFWAMLTDVQELIAEALDSYEEKREQDELLTPSSPLEV